MKKVFRTAIGIISVALALCFAACSSSVTESSENAITAFGFATLEGATATIDAENHTVNVTVPYGTDVTALVATFTASTGATVTVGEASQESGTTSNNFTNSVTYTVKAEDGSTQDFVITVTTAKNSAKSITSFNLYERNNSSYITKNVIGTIDEAAHTITATVPYGTNVTKLIPVFSLSDGSSATVGGLAQKNAVTANDFTSTVTYTVTAANGTTQDYAVSVVFGASCTISFNGNGSTGGSMEDITTGENTTVVLIKNSYEKAGYVFKGWATSDTSTEVEYANGTSCKVTTSNVALYAVWTAGYSTYIVEYYLQNIDDENYALDSTLTQNLNGVTDTSVADNANAIAGFTYNSVLTSINGAVQTTGTINCDCSTVVKYYYTRNTVTVKFENQTIEDTGKYGAAITVTPEVPTKEHYTFSWSPAFTGTFPAVDTTYKETWTGVKPTVTYNGNGSTSGAMADGIFNYDTKKALAANAYERTATLLRAGLQPTLLLIKNMKIMLQPLLQVQQLCTQCGSRHSFHLSF